MLRLSCALAAALATVGCATSPESSAFGPGQISEATMKEVTRTLSLDEFEGRSPGALELLHQVRQRTWCSSSSAPG